MWILFFLFEIAVHQTSLHQFHFFYIPRLFSTHSRFFLFQCNIFFINSIGKQITKYFSDAICFWYINLKMHNSLEHLPCIRGICNAFEYRMGRDHKNPCHILLLTYVLVYEWIDRKPWFNGSYCFSFSLL